MSNEKMLAAKSTYRATKAMAPRNRSGVSAGKLVSIGLSARLTPAASATNKAATLYLFIGDDLNKIRKSETPEK